MIGTFLVRSGIVTSVHAFASDPTRGVFILMICAFFIFSSFILLAKKADSIKEEKLITPISKEGAIVFNNLLMVASTFNNFYRNNISNIFRNFYWRTNFCWAARILILTTTLIMGPAILVMSFAPMLKWKKDDFFGLLPRLKTILFLSLLISFIFFYIAFSRTNRIAIDWDFFSILALFWNNN